MESCPRPTVFVLCCRLYRHLGRITHVVVPWEHTWTFMAKCVGADVARVTAWAIVGSMVVAGGCAIVMNNAHTPYCVHVECLIAVHHGARSYHPAVVFVAHLQHAPARIW